MFKHANTFFPGDKVAEIKPDGTKVAGHQSGEVKGSHDGKLKVQWGSGVESFHRPDELQKL